MAISHNVLLAVYGLATVVGVALGVVVWRNREKTGALPLSLSLFATALYSGPLFVGTAADSVAVSTLMVRVLFLGIGGSVMLSFLFVLEYTGREELVTRKTVALLSIEPILAVVLAFINPGNVFFESFTSVSSDPLGIRIEWGIAAGLHSLYSYLIMIATTLLILELLYRSRSLYRGQAAALLGATAIPAVANAAYVIGPLDFDPTPIGYLCMGALFTVAILRYQLVDIVPIARNRVLDTVSDGVFVVDREDRLIDTNPVGRELLEDIEGSPIGRSIGSLFADLPELRAEYNDLTARPVETERELALLGGHYHVRTTPIDDGRDRHVGWLFLVRDITERKRRETKLERQNERLERFADIVSHDLRNPLAVADGYVDLARETGDMSHLGQVEQSHDRMAAIIDDVLTLAREGAAVTDPEPVALAALAEDAWAGVDTGDATLAVEGSTSVLADRDRLRRLLENLFRNAVEHGIPADRAVDGGEGTVSDASTPPLTVSVGAIGTNPIYGFYVADDGRGLPEDRDRLFQEGYTTDEEGTGFGLSIVEGIATAHGWAVDATESEAGGARFEFTGIETADTGGDGVSP